MSFRGGPFFIPVQSSAPEKDRIKLNHDGTHYPIPSVIGARVSFPTPNPTAASTHGCCPRAAASPRSCPSAAWRGSPAQAALGPPAAKPGSGQQRGARRRVSSCCGHRDCRQGLWSQRPGSTLPVRPLPLPTPRPLTSAQ